MPEYKSNKTLFKPFIYKLGSAKGVRTEAGYARGEGEEREIESVY